jgi:hypothetical protein
MAQYIGATGVGLPPPQALFPQYILNAPQISATNEISLPPGGDFIVPPGTWSVNTGTYSILQYLDPVTNVWMPYGSNSNGFGDPNVVSDGVNYRIINPMGFPVAAVVTNGGTGYTSAPTAAASAGGSTWLCLVGGALSAINISTASSGLNYAVPPIVNIAAPPVPGVQATAVATLSGGIVTNVVIQNPGAGYASPPSVTFVPQASDLNAIGTTTQVTNAKAVAQLSYVGVVTAVLLTNEGNNPLTAAPALTFSGGAGSGLAATILMQLTASGYTVTTAGSGYTNPVAIQTFGGSVLGLTSGIPSASTSIFIPSVQTVRQTIITGWVSSSPGGVVVSPLPGGGIVNPGIWTQPPQATVLSTTVVTSVSTLAVSAVVAITIASNTVDTVAVQPQ